MKVRWAEHEFALITIVGVLVLAGYLLTIPHLKMQIHEMSFVQGGNNPVLLNLFWNALLPDLGIGLLFYFCYIFINQYIFRRLLFKTKIMSRRKALLAVFLVLLLILFLGTCLNLANYSEYRWNYDYLKFPLIPEHGDPSQIDIYRNFLFVILIVSVYTLYACLREKLIRLIEKNSPGKAFRIMIANNITAFMVAYLAIIPIALCIFNVKTTNFSIGVYLYLLLCACTVFVNLFLIFPLKGSKSFLNPEIIPRLLLVTLLGAFPPLVFFDANIRIPSFFFLWTFQLVVIAPLSSLLYQQMQDKVLRVRGLENKLARSEADLQLLRSQINPHFLFNTLNTLYGMAMREGLSNTAEGIQKLGDMMRFMVHENSQDFIPMVLEIEYLKNYISLQKLRIATIENITIEDIVDQKHCNHQIAPMLLIPFVENAFKHGISLKERSWVKIRLECDDKYVHFRVCNSVHKMEVNDDQPVKSGIGIRNTEERLKLLYAGKYEFSTRAEGDQFVVDLSIELGN